MLGRKKGRGRVRVRVICHPPPPTLSKTRPISSSLLEFQHVALERKNIRAPEENGKRKTLPGVELDNRMGAKKLCGRDRPTERFHSRDQ